MAKISTINIQTEIIESNNKQHRYVLSKKWNDKRPMATVLTLYPSTSNLVSDDFTMMLITRNVHQLGYGGFYSVNLFSKYEIDNRSYSKASTIDNDNYILECTQQSKEIIFACGSLPSKNKQVHSRLEEIIQLLTNNQLHTKITYLSDEKQQKCYHPLASKVREMWYTNKNELS